MRILVLGGGNSPERDVSLRSSQAVAEALEAAGYEVLRADLRDGYDCLDNLEPDDIVFPILHGAEGEDGVVQAEMERRGLAFLGSDSAASSKCFDKQKSREAFMRAGIPVAEGGSVTKETYKEHELSKMPHVLKVQRGGSSIGTYLVPDPTQADPEKIEQVFLLDSEAIIEELVEGVEITVPVLDGHALPVIEIKPPSNEEFDYENKYNGATQEICPPVSVSKEQQTYAQALAVKVHQTMHCRHLSRTDIMIANDGRMAVLEVNTMPGMTNQSLFPLSAKVAGMPMPELMKKFVALVQRDYPKN